MYLGCIAEDFNGATDPSNIGPVTEVLMDELDVVFPTAPGNVF